MKDLDRPKTWTFKEAFKLCGQGNSSHMLKKLRKFIKKKVGG